MLVKKSELNQQKLAFLSQTGALEHILDGQPHFSSGFSPTDMLQMFIAESDHSQQWTFGASDSSPMTALALESLFLEVDYGGGILQNIGQLDIENDFIELTECEDQLYLLFPGVVVACGELVDLESAKTAALIHDS
jgi:hypothetical protein